MTGPSDQARDQAAGHHTIHGRFAARAAETPDRVAVLAADRTLTYGELEEHANLTAHRLRQLGVRPGDIVGVAVPRSARLIVALLGTLKAGAAYVALGGDGSADRDRAIIRHTGLRVLLTAVSPAGDTGPLAVEIGETAEAEPRDPGTAGGGGDDGNALAYVAYTSGTTGTPKGVAVPHRGVLRLLTDPVCGPVHADDRFLQFAPVGFDASTFELWVPLLSGAQVVCHPPETPSVTALAGFVREQRITCLWLTAGLFHQVAETRRAAFAGLRSLVVGGDVVSPRHASTVIEAFPRLRLVNGYGPTENTTFSCSHVVTAPITSGSVPIGRALPGSGLHVLTPALLPTPDGDVGELYVCGTGLARGYLTDAAATAARFVADPGCGDGGRMYRTGDLVRALPDGSLVFCGRVDREIKIRGFRVDLAEVEAAVASRPGVRDCVVVAHTDGDGSRSVVGFVVPDPQYTVSIVSIRAELARILPEHARPSRYSVVPELPLTANGKVDRAQLERRSTRERPTLYTAYAAPATTTERILADMWADLVGVTPVGVDDDFIELGGHSLLGMRIAAEIEAAFGMVVSPVMFYTTPTIRMIAKFIEESTRSPWHRTFGVMP